jgi:hypothetical protein
MATVYGRFAARPVTVALLVPAGTWVTMMPLPCGVTALTGPPATHTSYVVARGTGSHTTRADDAVTWSTRGTDGTDEEVKF